MSSITLHTEWHRQRIAALRALDGWLTLIDLIWLDDGHYRIGSDPAAEIQVPDGPRHWGSLAIEGTAVRWTDSAGQSQILKTDRDGEPTPVRTGRHSFFLIERDQRLAVRLRDEQAATRTGFKGIECFPFAAEWQIDTRWDGEHAHFTQNGAQYRLRPQNPAAETLHFVIADQTSGRETYGGGRFLFVPTAVDGTLRLDFNRAINPPCAFTAFAVCPLPPAENRLPFTIEAGEKTYR